MSSKNKRTKSASKPVTPLSQVRGAIGNKKDWAPLRWALESAKNDARIDEFNRLYKLAMHSPMASVAFRAGRPSTSGAGLQRVTPLETADLYREIAWACVAISYSKDQIEKYVKLRDQYEPLLMAGKFQEAFFVLDEIDLRCGISLWTIENRIALLATEGGFEKQRFYISELKAKYKRSFISFFATNIGERNEVHVSHKGYGSRLKDRAENWDIENEQKEYILYKLLGKTSGSFSAYASILSYEGASSVIDLYEALIQVLCSIATNKALKRNFVLKSIEYLADIDDHCFSRLKLLYSDDALDPSSLHASTHSTQPYLESFLSGDYGVCAEHLQRTLIDTPEDHFAIRLCGRVSALGYKVVVPDSTLQQKLCKLYGDYYIHESYSSDATEELEKISLNFRNLSFASCIALPAQDYSNNVPSLLPPPTLQSAIKIKRITAQAVSTIFPKRSANFYVENTDFTSSKSWLYQSLIDQGLQSTMCAESFSSESKIYAELSVSFRQKSFNTSLASLRVLETSDYLYFRVDADVLKAQLMFVNGFLNEALQQSVRLLISYPSLSRSLPLTQILKTRGFKEFKHLRGSIALPIAFYLYGTNTNETTKDVALKVSWRQFLSFYGVDRPSLLQEKIDQFDKTELIFFLRTVCIQEVMEVGSAFLSTADLDEERIQICILLTSLDPDYSSDYSAEIIELTRRLSIEDGVKLLESSRVYVDVAGIEKWSQKHLQEIFLRYMDYAGADLASSASELEKKLLEFMKSNKRKELATFLDNYDITSDTLLEEAISGAAAAFESLPRYGLDAFLGSRVRHGSLEISFRSPLERRKILTKIDSRSGEYESNSYWLDAIENVDQRKTLDLIFKKVAREIDAILDAAVNNRIYVKSAAHPEGLISIWPSEISKVQVLQRWVLLTKLQMTDAATLKQFLNHCISGLFWQSLSHSLLTTQRYIKTTLSREILQSLANLKEQIVHLLPDSNCAGMINYIRTASSEIETAAENVSNWFNPPQVSEHQAKFPLKTGIEIGLRSIKAIKPLFSPIIEWSVDPNADVLLSPQAFEMINDLAFLIFVNVSKHSGFEEQGRPGDARCTIKIRITRSNDKTIELCVENDIAPNQNLQEIDAKVITAKNAIASGDYDDFASRHKGTGLVRIASTVNYESDPNRTVDFGRRNNRLFYIEISVPVFLLAAPVDDHLATV